MRRIILIAHNLRSCHNVGSLLRTAEGLGLEQVLLTGYTPYPLSAGDDRLPHIARKLDTQIRKTALGAEATMPWKHEPDIEPLIHDLQTDGWRLVALEQSQDSVTLPDYQPTDKVALLVGREVEGIEPELLEACDDIVEIPMFGSKESYNVVQAAAMALYHLRFPG